MSITLSALQKQRRDTAANWTAADPTLLAGELAYESDTGKWKIGDGSTAWTSLAYTNWSQISAYPLVNADIAAAAAISVSKLANGTARQLLQTNAGGDGVEWASNIDVPGTLDVTNAATFDNNVTIQGDLTVNGTTTTIDTQTLIVEDKNIELGSVTTPTDVTADGGGITLKGTTDKTINWIDSTDAWTFSEHVNIASGKEYRIAGTSVLNATTLGSGVTGSSLTSVGIIGTGTWQGDVITSAYLPSGTTAATGIVQLEDSTSSTSTTTAATPNSVKSAYDLANAALPKTGGTMSGAIAMGTSKITGLGTPTDAADAATKSYVDTATSGISADQIIEGDTKAEVIDTGSDGRFVVTVENAEKFRVHTNGEIGIAGENYGTSGQVLTSQGSGSAPQWADAAGGGATGGGSDKIFIENGQTVTTDYTLGTTLGVAANAVSASPISINSGVTVTIPSGSNWVIV